MNTSIESPQAVKPAIREDVVSSLTSAEINAAMLRLLANKPAPRFMPESVTEVMLDESARSSFDFSDETCERFANMLCLVFVNSSGGVDKLRGDEGREAQIEALISETLEKDLAEFAQWLREETRSQTPGCEWLACAVEAYLKGLEIEREKAKVLAAAQKKKNRSGRRAASSGTVDIPADEGSRDDAGSDSKNNL